MMQQAGGGWSTDQAQGERGDLQRSARASTHGGLLPDPKEDANRVIEDILAVSDPPAQYPALVLTRSYGDSQQCMWEEKECDFILFASCSMGEEAALETTILSAEEQCGHWGSCMDCTLWRQPERYAQQIHSAAGRLKWPQCCPAHLHCASHLWHSTKHGVYLFILGMDKQCCCHCSW